MSDMPETNSKRINILDALMLKISEKFPIERFFEGHANYAKRVDLGDKTHHDLHTLIRMLPEGNRYKRGPLWRMTSRPMTIAGFMHILVNILGYRIVSMSIVLESLDGKSRRFTVPNPVKNSLFEEEVLKRKLGLTWTHRRVLLPKQFDIEKPYLYEAAQEGDVRVLTVRRTKKRPSAELLARSLGHEYSIFVDEDLSAIERAAMRQKLDTFESEE